MPPPGMYCGRERAERDRLFLRDEITRERERWLQVRCRRTGGGGEKGGPGLNPKP